MAAPDPDEIAMQLAADQFVPALSESEGSIRKLVKKFAAARHSRPD